MRICQNSVVLNNILWIVYVKTGAFLSQKWLGVFLCSILHLLYKYSVCLCVPLIDLSLTSLPFSGMLPLFNSAVEREEKCGERGQGSKGLVS